MPNESQAEIEMGGFLSKFIEIRFVSGKKSDILVEGGSASVKQGTYFKISTISS